MPALFVQAFRYAAIIILELLVFFFFYHHPTGRKAVYFSWYAWIIDVLAIASGTVIMAASVYAGEHPSLFAIEIPEWVFWLTFIVGSWQAAIHAVKLIIRTRRRREFEK